MRRTESRTTNRHGTVMRSGPEAASSMRRRSRAQVWSARAAVSWRIAVMAGDTARIHG